MSRRMTKCVTYTSSVSSGVKLSCTVHGTLETFFFEDYPNYPVDGKYTPEGRAAEREFLSDIREAAEAHKNGNKLDEQEPEPA